MLTPHEQPVLDRTRLAGAQMKKTMPNAWGKSLPRLDCLRGSAPSLLNNHNRPPKRGGESGKIFEQFDVAVQVTIMLSMRKMYFETVFLNFYSQTDTTVTNNRK